MRDDNRFFMDEYVLYEDENRKNLSNNKINNNRIGTVITIIVLIVIAFFL